MRWIVTGSQGQLGSCLVRSLEGDPGEELARACSHRELDVADPRAVARLLEGLAPPPDVLVNAAAFTAVDRCESEGEVAMRVNGEAPGHLARLCKQEGIRLVHVSTDYVFDGEGTRPYTEEAKPDPRSAYGRSKLAGERRVLETSPAFLVVRTSWVFGPGRNFVEAILRQARLRREGEASGPLRVVDDQEGCPTYAADLAEGIRALVAAGAGGLVHLSNGGACTWWDFARAILDEAGHGELEIERGRTEELDLPAPRPRYSVLDCSRAASLGVVLRPWRDALRDYLRSRAS
jgi:dTDP-4-dehydrorhamnose reductase